MNDMITTHSTETESCPFCGHNIDTNIDTCDNCGSKKVVGYINKFERRIVLILRIVLCVLASVVYYDNYPDPKNFLMGAFLFIISIIFALIIPLVIFKIKNKRNVVWRKRIFSM
ncbi:hypothetical protein SPM24T3_17100 [Serratia sp. M24T3]|nr:hypothetical protein SPM24T3_17100 [Serratia sp. M24T3]